MFERTTTALLQQLHDPGDADAWTEFDARCRPLLVGLGRKLGLRDEDAADAAQETLLRFVREYRAGRYHRERGGLRSWLLGIARHCILDQQRRRAARQERRGQSALDVVCGEEEVSQAWDEGHRRFVLQQAVETLRCGSRLDERTIRAFELIALQGRPADQVARELDMTMNDVYLAKYRSLKRLRALVARLDARYRLE